MQLTKTSNRTATQKLHDIKTWNPKTLKSTNLTRSRNQQSKSKLQINTKINKSKTNSQNSAFKSNKTAREKPKKSGKLKSRRKPYETERRRKNEGNWN
jgi:hypothetical protein